MERLHQDIVNPEIPETPEEKLALLSLCVAALRNGARVEGVTPHHVGAEGIYMLRHFEPQPNIHLEI